MLSAIRDAGGTLIYVLHTGPKNDKTPEFSSSAEPDVTHISLGELISPTLVTELSRSMTRARVQQYQRYMDDADRVLILRAGALTVDVAVVLGRPRDRSSLEFVELRRRLLAELGVIEAA